MTSPKTDMIQLRKLIVQGGALYFGLAFLFLLLDMLLIYAGGADKWDIWKITLNLKDQDNQIFQVPISGFAFLFSIIDVALLIGLWVHDFLFLKQIYPPKIKEIKTE